MLLDEVMAGLRDVGRGKAVMTPEQADNVLDAIYLLLERRKVTENRLAYYKELEREGRLKIAPPVTGERCGTCRNYDRISGMLWGYCRVRREKHHKDQPLAVSRSRKACKTYHPKEK